MARTTTSTLPPTPASVSPVRAIELLQRVIFKGEEIANRWVEHDELTNWTNTAEEYLIRAFGSDSQQIKNVRSAGSSMVIQITQSAGFYEQERKKELRAKI